MTDYTAPTGNAVVLDFGGAYAAPAGNNVILNFQNANSYVLSWDSASYNVSGTAIGLKVGRRLRLYEQLIPGMAPGAFSFRVDSIAGWTSTLDSFALVSNRIQITDSSAHVAYIPVTGLTPGRTYRLEGNLVRDTAAIGMAVGTTAGGQQLGSIISFANGLVITSNPVTSTYKTLDFVAPAGGTVYVSLFMNSSGSASCGFLRIEETGYYKSTGTDLTLIETGLIMPITPGSYALAGADIGLRVARRIPIDAGVYGTIGTNIALRVGHRLPITPGSYAITGPGIGLTYIQGRFIRPDEGSYAMTGTDIRLLYARKMPITPSSYAITWDTGLSYVYRRALKIDAGSYALSGTVVSLKRGLRLPVTPGSYVLAGTDFNVINRRLSIDPGAYVLNGTNVGLVMGRRLQVTPGAYNLTGASIALLYARRMAVTPGSYALTGTDIGLKGNRRLQVTAGAYALTGTPIRLARGYTVRVNAGSYAISGVAPSFRSTRTMLLNGGAYHLTMTDVTVTPTWRPRGPRAIAVGVAASRYLAVPPQDRRVSVEPQDRRLAVEPAARRYAAVEPRDI